MSVYFSADNYFVGSKIPVDEATLGDADATIEGDKVIWVLGTALTGARTFTLRNYDQTRFSCYKGKKPVLVIKCAVATDVNNAVIQDEDATALFTFATDHSVTPGYAAFTVDSSGDWELI